MPWVITSLCRDCVDEGCVTVCPVDCIYKYKGDDRDRFPNQLFIDPEECIDCGVCEPECPWGAIFEGDSVPQVFHEDIALNRAVIESKSEFEVPSVTEKQKPTPDQVRANKEKWGFEG